MQIKQIEAFVLVAETGSFTKAARIMFMTQPAISFQIKALEQELGVPLLERSEKRVFLTDVGKVLYDESKEILGHYQKVLSHIADVKGLSTGNLSIGASTIPGEYIIPKAMGSFKERFPGIDMTLKIGSSQRVFELLLEREIQLGITGSCPDNPGLSAEKFLVDYIVPIISPSNLLAERPDLTLIDFLNEPLIMREEGSGTRAAIERAIASGGLLTLGGKTRMELGSTRSIITAVEANLGVSFVSKWAINDQLASGSLRIANIKDFELQRELYIVTPRNSGVRLLVDRFIDHLHKYHDLS